MIRMYNTDMNTNKTEKVKEYKRGNWINMVSPSQDEIKRVCENINIQEDFIRYALDFEEKARIDYEEDDGTTLFIVDVPIIEKEKPADDEEEGNNIYTTMPLGMIFVRDEYFITVSLKKNKIIEELESGLSKDRIKGITSYKKSRLLLHILYKNASYYLTLLKRINRETEIAENVLKNSMRNKELLKLLSLDKSLVYLTTSLKSNEIVMEKTQKGKMIKLYEEDEDLLDDAIIENRQAMEMSRIYTEILNGTMDAYASIISNNLNVVMKILTAITIVISIPTLIASFMGMNVPVPFQGNPWGFTIIVIISVIVSIVSLIWLRKRGMMD